MSALPETKKGLWNLKPEERAVVYADLRRTLGLSEAEPMLPLAEAELKAWARRFSQLLAESLRAHPMLAPMADEAFIETALMAYGQPPTDAMMETHLEFGQSVLGSGVSGLYLHAVLNTLGMQGSARAAREVLSPEGQRIALERYPVVMILRHALMQEVVLGAKKH